MTFFQMFEIKAKLQEFQRQLVYFPRALELVWTPAPKWTVTWAILLIILGVLPAISVSLTRVIVDRLVTAMEMGASWESFQLILYPSALMGGVLVFNQLINGSLKWIDYAQSMIVQDYIRALIHQKLSTVDMVCYDSSEFHDQLQQVLDDASDCPLSLMDDLGSLVQNSITLIAMAAILLPYGLWLPIVLLLSTLPVLGVSLQHNRRYYQWRQKTTSDRRWTHYYDTMLTYEKVAPEVRLFNLSNHFQSTYQTLRRRLRQERLILIRNKTLASLAAVFLGLFVTAGALVWMIWRSLQGFLTLGDLALFYQAFNRGQDLMRAFLGDISSIYSNSLFLSQLFEFLDAEPKVVNPATPRMMPMPLMEGIEFQNVTFRYSGSSCTALNKFNLKIPAGKTVAIVGDNGAGKSTLIKLLCRFYDPEEGSIRIDGIDIRDLSIEELRRQITVLFQLPVRYQATALQNIALGDLTCQPSFEDIQLSAHEAGAHEVISRLSNGYETLLGKSFVEGTDLSGGEWQRVALARACFRQSPIIVLDEPTSAMDPWAEAQWLNRFSDLVQDRTALIITHRFTAALRADMIHLMCGGEIVESGTHEELLVQKGRYAQAWQEQTQANPRPLIKNSR